MSAGITHVPVDPAAEWADIAPTLRPSWASESDINTSDEVFWTHSIKVGDEVSVTLSRFDFWDTDMLVAIGAPLVIVDVKSFLGDDSDFAEIPIAHALEVSRAIGHLAELAMAEPCLEIDTALVTS